MKKLFAMCLVMLMILSMAACGNETASAPEQDNIPSVNNDVSEPDAPENDSQDNDVTQVEEPEVPEDTEADTGDDIENVEVDGSIENTQADAGSSILVAYFSRVGNTTWEDGVDAVTSASLNVENGEFVGNAEYLAKMAQEVTGGDLFLIQTEQTYPSAYRDTTDVAKEEQNNDARPALATHVENMDQYDTIILIYPNWWGTIPMPLYTFLEEYDFSGKTILPLCTHEGSRMGSSESAIAGLCPDAILLEGLSVRGSDAPSAQSDVEDWINCSGILEQEG